MILRNQSGSAFQCGRWPLNPELPTLVFIHGSGQQGSFWQAQIDGLSDIANTIALDLPGHGQSGGAGFKTVADYAQSVRDFIDAIKAPAPIPCGLSLGGAITLDLLIHYPERLKAGILANTGARLKVLPSIIDTIARDYGAHLNNLIEWGVAPINQSNQALCQSVLAGFTAGPLVAADDFRACDRFDAMGQLSQIHLPVLVLSAQFDRLTPVKYAAYLTANIDGARHVTILKAGHMSPIERPEAFNAAVAGFLKSLDP